MSFYPIVTTICILTTSLLFAMPSGAKQPLRAKIYPTSGKVLQLTSGDLMCYVNLIDARGKKHTIGAIFEICEQSQFLNQQVQLTYKPTKVNDCQSAEPCGKTKIENAIVKMKLVRRK
jgi:hypothetical protein